MKLSHLLSFLLLPTLFALPAYAQEATIDTGNTAWLLLCSALVMLMTPGLAFFYAGMVNRKNVVSTLLQNYVSLAVISLLWVVVGYSLAFGEGGPYIGDTSMVMLKGLSGQLFGDTGIPHYGFMVFQMMFAVITPALITGAFAERVNFAAWVLMLGLWSLAVYSPVAHWVWGPEGWIAALGGLDFAGGLVVHITAGVAALVSALMFGRRFNAGELSQPSDVSMVMLGAALLWFGWFGFNAGSALTAGSLAAHAFVTTVVGAAASFLAWMAMDWIKRGKPSAIGGAIGLVVGLVVITPAAGFVTVGSAMIMCAISAVICYLIAESIKHRTKLDDALDVFACHGMGGILGAVMTGLFATKEVNDSIGNEGLFISGDTTLFFANCIGVAAVVAYTAVVTWLLLKLVNAITPIRVSDQVETQGLDEAVHGEMLRYYDPRQHALRSLHLD